MNYSNIYNQLVEVAQNRVAPTCYTEVHHITPKCMGGNDDKSNLVTLTAKEHYMAHRLLELMYPENKKLSHAARMMAVVQNKYQPSARIVSHYRSKSYIRTDETREKISKAHKGKKKTKEHQAKITQALKGRVFTKEWRSKMSEVKKLKLINTQDGSIHYGYQSAADSIGITKNALKYYMNVAKINKTKIEKI